MNKIIVATLAGMLAFGFVLSAQAHVGGGAEADINSTSSIGITDLGVENVGTLPSSHFYFFKEWRRGIQRIFTFNKTAKAELELSITNEKAAEILGVEQSEPDNSLALQTAITNYAQAQVRLKDRLAEVEGDSNDTGVARLIEKVDSKTQKHLFLLLQVSGRHHPGEITVTRMASTSTAGDCNDVSDSRKGGGDCDDNDAIREAVALAQAKIEDTVVLNADNDKDIQSRAADEIAHAEVAIAHALVGDPLPSGKSATLNVSASPGGSLQAKQDDNTLPDTDIDRETLAKGIVVKKPAGSQSDSVRMKQSEIKDNRQSAISDVRATGSTLDNAKLHLADAKRAYAAGHFALAFGQARSAIALAMEQGGNEHMKLKTQGDFNLANNFKIEIDGVIVGGFKQVSGLESETERMEHSASSTKANRPGRTKYSHIILKNGTIKSDTINAWRKAVIDGKTDRMSGSVIYLDKDDKEIARYNFFEAWPVKWKLSELNAGSDMRTIEELDLEVGGIRQTPKGSKPIRGKVEDTTHGDELKSPHPLHDQLPPPPEGVNEPKPQAPREDSVPKPEGEAVMCTQEYRPVCGTDGKTYSNSCMAEGAHVAVSHGDTCTTTSTSGGVELQAKPL